MCTLLLCAFGVFGQNEIGTTTELVIEDFETTGLGNNGGFGISLGGLFAGSTALDIHFDFFVNPLVALRLGINTIVPISAPQIDVAFDLGFGAIWRSYVINRIRFYGGLMLRAGMAPLSDQDLLFIPEGFGGFEFYADPKVSIFAEFGGRSALPIVSLNGGQFQNEYIYANGFFFRLGSRFGF